MIKEMLNAHNLKEKVSFHMPGHKSGKGFSSGFLQNPWKYDATELTDTDCLRNPKQTIKKAQEHAAKLYGARDSFFLVNGASCGILSMFCAFFQEGDTVAVDRNCHESAVNAMIMSGVNPVYFMPSVIEEHSIFGRVEPSVIEKIFSENKNIKGVFLTSPTYYGASSDIEKIAKIVHKNNAYLLVDESHGAHFPFSEKMPQSAVESGADAAVVSMHKSMMCPNQTAILNIGNCNVSREKIQKAVNMFQTTSPSYVFMYAMDEALLNAEMCGEEKTQRLLSMIPKSTHLFSLDDPFKVIADFTDKGYSGGEIAKILEEKFGIFCELSDEYNVLLMTSWANDETDFDILKSALCYIESLPQNEAIEKKKTKSFKTETSLSPRNAYFSDGEYINIKKSAGRIALETAVVFPPCVPVILPGEKITQEQIDALENKAEQIKCAKL